MENTLLVGLSRQMVLRRQLDVIANNVANLNTAGFKADDLVFAEHMMPRARVDAFSGADKPVRFVIDPRTVTNHRTGTIEQTGGELDVALQGDGFFVVENPGGGERFTRAGAFQLNAQGELVMIDGRRVLSEGGPITFTAADGRVAIGADGTISTNQGVRGRLRLAQFANPGVLQKVGDNLFQAPQGVQPEQARTTRVLQGAIERSNVQPVLEMGKMIEVTRAYQTVSQMLERTQDLRRTAVERLAQLP